MHACMRGVCFVFKMKRVIHYSFFVIICKSVGVVVTTKKKKKETKKVKSVSIQIEKKKTPKIASFYIACLPLLSTVQNGAVVSVRTQSSVLGYQIKCTLKHVTDVAL
ncbi:hypothetical protein V8C37DRAFT_351360 [Trichoderma ceciliae]